MEYIDRELSEQTKYKSIVNAYQKNEFGLVKSGNVFWIESPGLSNRTYLLIIKECKRIFKLKYLYDVESSKVYGI